MRDHQRQKVYDAERRAESTLRQIHRDSCGPNCRPVDVGLSRVPDDHCQSYVDEVCEYVRVPPITVELDANEQNAAQYERDAARVVLPPWARNKITILHELAHHMTHRYFPGHGAEFVENFLMLLRTFLPPAVHDAVIAELVETGAEVKASGKQGVRFLVYAHKLLRRGDRRKIVVITHEPRRYVGWMTALDRETMVTLAFDEGEEEFVIPMSSVRYATWWTP